MPHRLSRKNFRLGKKIIQRGSGHSRRCPVLLDKLLKIYLTFNIASGISAPTARDGTHTAPTLNPTSPMNMNIKFKHSKFSAHRIRFVGALLLAVALTVQQASAKSYKVDNLSDSGPGSLRAAILKANASPGADVINFSHELTGTLTLTSGELLISGDLAINGPQSKKAAGLTVSGNNVSRVFNVSFGSVNIAGLSVTAGSNATGGGIYNGGALTLNDVTVSMNQGANGAGIYNSSSGTLVVMDSTVSKNTSTGKGGGIYNAGTLTSANSTVSGNQAAQGGGIYNEFGSTLTFTNVTVSNNQASVASGGGGIYDEPAVTSKFGNSIVAGNRAGGSPGTSSDPGADVFATVVPPTGTAFVAGGSVTSQGYNLIGNKDGSAGWTSTDITGTSAAPKDPKLGLLTDNGGPTQTMSLLVGSPAINAGSNALAKDPTDLDDTLKYDQRGSHYKRIVTTTVDIGAFEVQVKNPAETAHEWDEDELDCQSAQIPSGDDANDSQLRTAADRINRSMDPEIWVDASHLTSKGQKHFERQKQAVSAQLKIQGASAYNAQGSIDNLMTANSLLAATAINDASAGNATELAAANASANAAESSKAQGAYVQAIENYSQAWQHAQKALNKEVIKDTDPADFVY